MINTHGPVEGLMSYSHTQFPDAPEDISAALIRNRELSATGQVRRSDVLVVNNGLVWASEADPQRASMKKVLDMDQEGKLLNAQGERYEKIVFSHCRSSFDSKKRVSGYIAVEEDLKAIVRTAPVRWQRAIYETTVTPRRGENPQRVEVNLVAVYIYRENPLPAIESASDRPPTINCHSFAPRERDRVMSFHSSADRW